MALNTISKVERLVNDVFTMAIALQWDHAKLFERLSTRVHVPMCERTPGGKRKCSLWLCGYASGYIASRFEEIWRERVEFCYLVDGVLYSTHKKSDRPSTEVFYAAGRGCELGNAVGCHYWKGTNKPFGVPIVPNAKRHWCDNLRHVKQ